MSNTKKTSRALAHQKRKRRQWLTFMRMCRYGINNFSRNAWLTIAATAVMTITLLIVFVTLSARNVLVDTVGTIRDKVDVSVYVKTDVSDKDVESIRKSLMDLPSVKRVTYTSPEQARELFANANKESSGTLNALNEATNKFPGTFRINPVDINDTIELQSFVKNDEVLKVNIDPNREPSFAGERKSAIQSIGRWVGFAEKAGLIASIIFMSISSLIVFNTIRMAIFNRKDEIQMMKLIGADRNFIRGPFIVEAVVYGFIAAILATILGVILISSASSTLLSYGIVVDSTLNMVKGFLPLVVIAMILLGSLIGVVSSLLATRRYLKI